MWKLLDVPRRVGARVARTRADKRALAQVARRLARRLEPGLWWFAAAHVLARARRRRDPRHFRSGRAVGSRASGRALLRALVPPWWVWIPRRASPAAPASRQDEPLASMLRFLDGPGAVATLFDRTGTAVTRVAIDRPVPRRVLAVRRALRAYLRMPVYEVADDRRVVREEQVDGYAFDRLSLDERAATFESLLADYARLVRHEGRSPRPTAVSRAFEGAAVLARRDAGWRRSLASRDAAVACAARWPCVPAHGDLSVANLVVAPGGAYLIDFEFADVLPFFYDVVKLALDEASCGRVDLLAGIRTGGRFERRWRDLWSSAGCASRPDPLVPVLTSVVVLYARRLQRHRPRGGERAVLEGRQVVPELGFVPWLRAQRGVLHQGAEDLGVESTH